MQLFLLSLLFRLLAAAGVAAAFAAPAAPPIAWVARGASAGPVYGSNQELCVRRGGRSSGLRMNSGDDAQAEARRAAYLRERDAREEELMPERVDMEALFGDDTVPDYIERWGGMHRQVAMEGPTRKALEMAMDSEWAQDSWTDTPTKTESEGTPTLSD